jgi:predicted enzyme related to lactoylglutathione lyase
MILGLKECNIFGNDNRDDDNKMPINAGAINGALMTDDSVDYPLIVITVGSIDATLVKVKQNGGNVILRNKSIGYGVLC